MRADERKKVVNKDLAKNQPPERSQAKPSKSQLKPQLRYYPVTLLSIVKAVWGGFQSADIQALFVLFRPQI